MSEFDFIHGTDLHTLAAESSVRWCGFISEPNRHAERLNRAMRYHVETTRWHAAQPSSRQVRDWRERLSGTVQQASRALGSELDASRVSSALGVEEADLNSLRAALIDLAQRASAEIVASEIGDPGKKDMARWMLFHQLAQIFEDIFGTPFSRTIDPKTSRASGPAMEWVRRLLSLASAREHAPPEIRRLAEWAAGKAPALAAMSRLRSGWVTPATDASSDWGLAQAAVTC